jgi:hypothetical protein
MKKRGINPSHAPSASMRNDTGQQEEIMKEIKFSQTVSAFLVISALFFALPGCQKQEGPLEKAGDHLQDAAKP